MVKKLKKNDPACKETFDPLLVEGKTPATAILLLGSPEEDVLVRACEAIHAFAEKGDENRASLLGLGALEPLCRLVTHEEQLVRRYSLMALGVIATNSDAKTALGKLHVIPAMIEKLSPEENTVVHEFATLCLSSLSVDFTCKVQILDNEGLPPLIQLLSSPDPDVKKNSVETIYHLVQDFESRQAVNQLSGIHPLLELLKSEFIIIQVLALKTLQTLTVDKETHGAFRAEHGFEKLMHILNNKDFSDLHVEALHVVANCLNDYESFQLIQKEGGLTRLMDFILTSTLPEVQSTAIKCIARVAQSYENRKLLHENEVEKVLVDLLSVENAGVKTAACQAVAAMSLQLVSKDSFRELAAVPLLSTECLELREAATLALSVLTSGNIPNAFAVYEAGGHEILVRHLQDSVPATVGNAAATLANIAGQEVIRQSISLQEPIPALVESLKSTNTHVLSSTALCLAELACEAEARANLRTAGGLQPLVSLLQSSHHDVLHSTCLAVNVCATDEATAVEMSKHGALEMLQEINQSVNRRSKFSKLAMISLLNSNLPLKYSVTGRLASTDIISTGFYDTGKAHSGQRVLTLEELYQEPVSQQRPVIAVNTGIEETPDIPEWRQSVAPETPDTSTPVKAERKKRRRKKDEDKQKDESLAESPTEKPEKMLDDVALQELVKQAKEDILQLNDDQEQYEALARLVSDAMGGAVGMEDLHHFPWELHLSELKFQLQSNVVPIGMIERGIYCHRALLFKCLADTIGVSCTLVRGDYNRAWNEVVVFQEEPTCRIARHFIVDLMHQPGNLLEAKGPAAVQYQTI